MTTEVRWQWLTPRGDHKSEMMMGDLQEVKKLECVVFFFQTSTGMAYVHTPIEYPWLIVLHGTGGIHKCTHIRAPCHQRH